MGNTSSMHQQINNITMAIHERMTAYQYPKLSFTYFGHVPLLKLFPYFQQDIHFEKRGCQNLSSLTT